MEKQIKDIETLEEVEKICKQPEAKPKDKDICFDCPLFLGFCCYANIMFTIQQEVKMNDK